jgi:hypothetical protein
MASKVLAMVSLPSFHNFLFTILERNEGSEFLAAWTFFASPNAYQMIGKLEPVLVWCIGLHYQGPYLIGMK